ncbi:transposase, partial [Sinorhizobium meliloti]|nr:transposase [Sinorhizobium meliloti]
MEEDEQKLQVRLVGRNGRRRFDPASKDRLVSACHEPGVSVSRLALDHGVNVPIPMKPPLCSEMIAPPVSGMISPPV